MSTDIVQAMHMAEEMKGYADKHLIDATDPQEPDYEQLTQELQSSNKEFIYLGERNDG